MKQYITTHVRDEIEDYSLKNGRSFVEGVTENKDLLKKKKNVWAKDAKPHNNKRGLDEA